VSGKGNFFRLQLYSTAFLVACNLVGKLFTVLPSLASKYGEKPGQRKAVRKSGNVNNYFDICHGCGSDFSGVFVCKLKLLKCQRDEACECCRIECSVFILQSKVTSPD